MLGKRLNFELEKAMQSSYPVRASKGGYNWTFFSMFHASGKVVQINLWQENHGLQMLGELNTNVVIN